VVAVTSVSGPRVDPAPLFDLVTGFPPDDALDVTGGRARSAEG
jgi:hypothetical protein